MKGKEVKKEDKEKKEKALGKPVPSFPILSFKTPRMVSEVGYEWGKMESRETM